MGFFRKSPVETVPAAPPSSITQKVADGANAALDKAAAIYKRNPKLIGGLAVVAGALLLTRMARGTRPQ